MSSLLGIKIWLGYSCCTLWAASQQRESSGSRHLRDGPVLSESQTQTDFWGRRFPLGPLGTVPLPYCRQYAQSSPIFTVVLLAPLNALNAVFPTPTGFRSPVGYTEHFSHTG